MPGRIRTIKPELLEDDKTAALSSDAWRLFVSLLLVADDYGNVRAHPAQLEGAVFWGCAPREPLANLLETLANVSLITRYSVRGQEYLAITGWSKHQKVDRPGQPRVPGPKDTEARILGGIREPLANDSRGIPGTLAPDPDLRPLPPTSDHDHDHEGDHEIVASGAAPAHEPPTTPAKRQKPQPSQTAQQIALHLLQQIRTHLPDALDHSAAWAKDIDLAIRLDGRTARQLLDAIDYAHTSEAGAFWRSNLLSGAKLRKHLDTLEAQRLRPAQSRSSPAYINGERIITPRELWEQAEREERTEAEKAAKEAKS